MPGKQVRLHTHLHFKEDALALYGFATPDQLRLFLLLMNVSGIGPRNALRMLSVMSPMDLVAAIASDDIETLTRVPGNRPQDGRRGSPWSSRAPFKRSGPWRPAAA